MRRLTALAFAATMFVAVMIYLTLPTGAVTAFCGNLFSNPLRPGSMMVTARNTVVCASRESTIKLSRAKSMIDLPPYLLSQNGCLPAAGIVVRVAQVEGQFLGVRFPHASDQERTWWTLSQTTPSGH